MDKIKQVRPVDNLTDETYSWWKKTFVFIKKTKVKTWQGAFAIAFFGGIAAALIWAVSFEVGPFSSAAPKYTGTADLSWDANSEADLAGYNIYYGTTARTGNDPNACTLCGYTDKVTVEAEDTSYSFSELANSQIYYFSITAFDSSGNESAFSNEVSKTTEADITAPVRSAGAPAVAPNSTTLDAGTTQTAITLSTDEDATCKYSVTSGTAYASMTNTFSETGGVDHSTTVSGLSNGQTYHYYVRCQDTAVSPNANIDDYEITFQISSSADTTAPVRSAGLPNSELQAGTTSAVLSLETNENADCKYGTVSNTAYASIASTFSTTGGTSHSANITGLSNGLTYNYYVRCRDKAGTPNANTDDYTITFSIGSDVVIDDKEAPVLSAGAPSGTLDSGTVQTNLTLSTSEEATCKYSVKAGTAYASMSNTFGTTGETDHSTVVSGLSNGNTYHYYVRCQDEAETPNVNTNDYEITFSISDVKDSTAPVRSNGDPSGSLSSGTNDVTISLSTNENATCKLSSITNTSFDSMAASFSNTGGTSHSTNVSGLSSGNTYNYYVRCKDSEDNINTDDYVISFSVDKKSSDSKKDKKSSSKKTVKKREIKNSPKTVSRGKILIQSGKRFSKSSNVALYFSRPTGGYYPPQIIKTNNKGNFTIAYKVNKPQGKYGWYAVDLKSGWKSKTITYRVR
ncbi:MAG: hypothetical protein PHQ46_09275 [Negativicutes bacterium]|nr:hypothetical protein [Negativicutes bacterium]